MAIKRIPASAIHAGQPYRDGEIITGTMVNEVVKVLKDGVNYNKFFIDAMFAGTTEEAIVIGVPKGTLNTTAEDIAQLEDFVTDNGITVDDGQKAFVFRCIYGNVDDPTEITGVQALNYYKYSDSAGDWIHQYAVSMDNFIQGLSSDFADYDEVTTLADADLFVVKDISGDKPVVITKESLKETIGVNDVNQRVDDVLDGTTIVKKSEQDKNGNDIFDTYETKSDATSKLVLKADKTYVDAQDQALDDYFENEITKIKDGTTIVKKAEQDKNGNDIVDTYETKGVVSGINSRLTSLESDKLDKIWTDLTNQTTSFLTDEFVLNRGNSVYKTTLATMLSNVAATEIFVVVQELPEIGQINKIYLVISQESEVQNIYEEFIWAFNEDTEEYGWERIGSVSIDLSNYYNKTEIDGLLTSKVDKVAGKWLSTNDYTDEDKQDVEKIPTIEQDIVDLENDKVDKNNAITAGTKTKITYDAKGLVTGGSDLVETDIPNLDTSKITTGTLGVARGGTGRTDGYAVGVVETRASVLTKIWTGTQAQYDAIVTKDANTLYFIM